MRSLTLAEAGFPIWVADHPNVGEGVEMLERCPVVRIRKELQDRARVGSHSRLPGDAEFFFECTSDGSDGLPFHVLVENQSFQDLAT